MGRILRYRLVSDRIDGSPEWLRQQLGDAADGFFSNPYLLWFVAEDPVRNGRLTLNVVEIIRVIVAAARENNVATLQDRRWALRVFAALRLCVKTTVRRSNFTQRREGAKTRKAVLMRAAAATQRSS